MILMSDKIKLVKNDKMNAKSTKAFSCKICLYFIYLIGLRNEVLLWKATYLDIINNICFIIIVNTWGSPINKIFFHQKLL